MYLVIILILLVWYGCLDREKKKKREENPIYADEISVKRLSKALREMRIIAYRNGADTAEINKVLESVGDVIDKDN